MLTHVLHSCRLKISANKPVTRLLSSPLPLCVLLQNTDFKPVPLKAGEEEDYMLALKQEMRGTMQRLPHNIKPNSSKAGKSESSALETCRLIEMLWQDNFLLWGKIMQHLRTKTFNKGHIWGKERRADLWQNIELQLPPHPRVLIWFLWSGLIGPLEFSDSAPSLIYP